MTKQTRQFLTNKLHKDFQGNEISKLNGGPKHWHNRAERKYSKRL